MATKTLDTTAVVSSGARSSEYIASGALAQGQIVYLNPTTREVTLALADAVGTKVAVGMCQQTVGASGGPVDVAYGGTVTGLTGLVKGEYYVLSATVAGDVSLASDLLATEHNVLIGVAASTTSLILLVNDWGVVL